jgi:hypothetical protein
MSTDSYVNGTNASISARNCFRQVALPHHSRSLAASVIQLFNRHPLITFLVGAVYRSPLDAARILPTFF